MFDVYRSHAFPLSPVVKRLCKGVCVFPGRSHGDIVRTAKKKKPPPIESVGLEIIYSVQSQSYKGEYPDVVEMTE